MFHEKSIDRRGARGRLAWLLLLATVVLLAGLGMPQTAGATDGPRLSFDERAHDFGQISSSQPSDYRFTFTNTGNGPLLIGDVRVEPASATG